MVLRPSKIAFLKALDIFLQPQRVVITGSDELLANHRNVKFRFSIKLRSIFLPVDSFFRSCHGKADCEHVNEVESFKKLVLKELSETVPVSRSINRVLPPRSTLSSS